MPSETWQHSDRPILAISVGNTRTRLGLFKGAELHDPKAVSSDRPDEVAGVAATLAESVPDVAVVLSHVNPPAAERIESALTRTFDRSQVYRIGADLPIAIRNALDDDSTVGQDRLLAALGAYSRAEQACIVIDAGTAITVDFVDGEGVFQGGAIGPGLGMMLRAMHEQTAALPLVQFAPADEARGVFGKDTRHAMILGVKAAAIGMVHYLIDTYAAAYEAYPQVIATGGDAALLFSDDALVEHVVPDLVLMGIAEACARALDPERAGRDDEDSADRDDE